MTTANDWFSKIWTFWNQFEQSNGIFGMELEVLNFWHNSILLWETLYYIVIQLSKRGVKRKFGHYSIVCEIDRPSVRRISRPPKAAEDWETCVNIPVYLNSLDLNLRPPPCLLPSFPLLEKRKPLIQKTKWTLVMTF